MAAYATHRSVADADRALALARTTSPFTIELRFDGGDKPLTSKQQAVVKAAAGRWTKVIVGDLPDVTVDGETIDDLLAIVKRDVLDGPGGMIAKAEIDPDRRYQRPAGSGPTEFLPSKGTIILDTADVDGLSD